MMFNVVHCGHATLRRASSGLIVHVTGEEAEPHSPEVGHGTGLVRGGHETHRHTHSRQCI